MPPPRDLSFSWEPDHGRWNRRPVAAMRCNARVSTRSFMKRISRYGRGRSVLPHGCTNGLDALHAHEIDGSIRATGFPTRHKTFCSVAPQAAGRDLQWRRVREGRSRIRSKRAHSITRSTARGPTRCPCEFGKRLASATRGRRGCSYVRGWQCGERDLLIGCDGIHSVTRAHRSAPQAHVMRLGTLALHPGLHVPVDAPATGTWSRAARIFLAYVVDPPAGSSVRQRPARPRQ